MTTPDLGPLKDDLTPQFELGAELGRGAFGAVLKARDRNTGREVALKLLTAEHKATTLERFVREAVVTARLDHPGIVRVHAVGRFSGSPCIVYELVDGHTLDEALRTRDLPQRVALVRDAALAIGHAHANGVLHRDLKPGNILVDRDGRVRVTDFGLALFEGADRLTRTGAMVGTPTYMAPELFTLGPEGAKATADVWALGVVLYEALTGRSPFDGSTFFNLVVQIDKGVEHAPRSIDPRISPALEAVCLRALARDPAQRQQDAAALARDLDRALTRPEGGSRAPLVLVLVLVLALALALVLALGARPAVPLEEPSPPTSTTAPVPAPSAPTRVGPLASGSGAEWALFTHDAAHVVTGGEHVPLSVWNVATGELERKFALRVVSGTRGVKGTFYGMLRDRHVELVDLATGVATSTQVVSAMVTRAAANTPILALIETTEQFGQFVTIYDYSVPKVREWLLAGTSAWRSVAISPDGRTLALVEPVGTTDVVQVFDVTGASVERARHELATVDCALCFVDDETLVVGTTTGSLHVFGARGTQALAGFDDAERRPASTRIVLAASADGRRLVSATQDARRVNVAVYDVATRQRQVDQDYSTPGLPLALDVAPGGGSYALTVDGTGVHVRPLR